jgi:WG containing repeat
MAGNDKSIENKRSRQTKDRYGDIKLPVKYSWQNKYLILCNYSFKRILYKIYYMPKNSAIILLFLMLIAYNSSAQRHKRPNANNRYQPSFIYFNYYNDVQMIEVTYFGSWKKASSTPEAMRPTAIPWEAKNPMPPSSYIFRDKQGKVVKQYLAHHEQIDGALAKPGTATTIPQSHNNHKDETGDKHNYHWTIMQHNKTNVSRLINCSADLHYRYKVFSSTGKVGLIDTLGNLILDTLYTHITCADSVYYFSLEYKTGIMTKDFVVLFPAEHDHIQYFDKGLYLVTDYHYYGFIDKKGKPVTPVKYYGSPGEFHDGLLMVLQVRTNEGNKWGFIDSTGKEVIELKYQSLRPFQNGLALAEMNNKYGFIDKKGNTIIDFKYDYLQPFANGYAKIKFNNKYGMINTKGEEVIPCEYTILEEFSEGLAAVSKANTGGPHIGYINIKNEVVIPFIYNNAWPFEKGKAKVQKADKQVYINHKGVEIPATHK